MNSTSKIRAVSSAVSLLILLASQADAAAPDRATVDKIAKLSVPFVPNAGQWDSRAAFAAQTFAGTLFVTKDGELVYSLPGKPIDVGADSAALGGATVGADLAALPRRQPSRAKSSPTSRTPGWVLSETLVDAKGQPRSMSQSTLKSPAGYRLMEGKVSYAVGSDPAKHADNLNTYERVNLGDMYPGVNVQLRATGNNVEKIFTVAPNHDPKQIHIKLAGANKLEIGTQGELIAHTDNGPVSFTAPIAFQQNPDGTNTPVTVAYALNAEQRRYSFTLGIYDETKPLIIDPLLQSTYLGGSVGETADAMAIHPTTGEVYIAGQTDSLDLPSVSVNAGGLATGAQQIKSGGNDAFVTRFNRELTARLQSSYLGGAGDDRTSALAIHPATGEVYIVGSTNSADLPGVAPASGGVANGAQTNKSGVAIGYDAYVTRFNRELTARPQSTYLGGSENDFASGLAIHPATGDVYIAGSTDSANLPSVNPASGGVATGAQSVYRSGTDAFVTRFNRELTTALQSSYLGGIGTDYGYALTIHPESGEVYVAGETGGDLPGVTVATGGVATGAQSAYGGTFDAFVTRFNRELTRVQQSTYLGGTNVDRARALAIHPATGEVYIAGSTGSTDLPSVTPGSGGVATGAQSAKSGSGDAFVARFNRELTARFQSSYYGGAETDLVTALKIHPITGEVYLAGETASIGLPGSLTGAQTVYGGNDDGFITRFNRDLTEVRQWSYLGGASTDWIGALEIHPATGEVYAAGFTRSSNFPKTTPANGGAATGAQSALRGNADAFVSRFTFDLSGQDFIPDAFSFAPKLNVPISSLQTSNPVHITGVSGFVPVSIQAGNFAEFCVSTTVSCACDLLAFGNAPSILVNGWSVCVRQAAPAFTPAQAKATLVVGGSYANFMVTTGGEVTSCNLDIDGSGGAPNAVSDGLMLVRAMLGFTGAAVTSGAIIGSPPRNTWALIRDYLNQNCGTSFAP